MTAFRPSPIFKYFAYDHLPSKLQTTSKLFHDVAKRLDTTLPDGPEKSVALRKLLEAKDAAVRSALDIPSTPEASFPPRQLSDKLEPEHIQYLEG